MIDIHCHILPGVDDGASDEQETKDMLLMAYREGVRSIIATSHYHGGMGKDEWIRREKALATTVSLAQEIASDFRIFPGSEIYYSQEVVEELKCGKVWTMNNSRYILVEFPVYAEFTYIRQAVQNLQYAGYLPILAHIERYVSLKELENVEELVDMGIYLQVNAGSVIGKDGRKVKKYILRLLQEQYIHFIGTDAHGSTQRRPLIKKCAAYISKKTDEAYCLRICRKNAEKIIRREYIDA